MSVADIHKTIDAVWRMESARLIAGLARIVRDVGIAEELAHDALVAALEQWPDEGIPKNPGAWLMATAKHRAIDAVRKRSLHRRKHDELTRQFDDAAAPVVDMITDALDDNVGDDMLRLIFVACHPVLSKESRVALTLRLLGGLTVQEIARAFLLSESTIAQRIVRAKKALAEAKVPFEVPRGDELAARLSSVLEVIYFIFNEGYTATSGSDWIRPALCEDALRLGRILAQLAPNEPEIHGLVALMEMQASRLGGRVGPNGEPILLLEQNRARWDHLLIRRGLNSLARAEQLVADGTVGPYVVQAELAACHARATTAEATDWRRIAVLYELLDPSPVVELNRAVAIGMAYGPAAGLAIVDDLANVPELADYHLLPGVRGDLLFKLGRFDEARVEFERAAALTRNDRERDLLLARARDSKAIT